MDTEIVKRPSMPYIRWQSNMNVNQEDCVPSLQYIKYIYIERVRLTTKEAPSLKVNIVYEQDAFCSCILAETLPFW